MRRGRLREQVSVAPDSSYSQFIFKSGHSRHANIADVPERCDHQRMIDIYESAVDRRGRYGVVFERDDDTSFLYLLDLTRSQGHQIIAVFDVRKVNAMLENASVLLEWDSVGEIAGLFIDGHLTALFDLTGEDPLGRYATSEDEARFVFH